MSNYVIGGFEVLLNIDKFYNVFKKTLKQKNFEIKRKISDNVYEISSGLMTFNIDVTDIRKEFLTTKSTAPLDELLTQLEIDFTIKYKLVSFHNAQNCLRLLLKRDENVKPNYVTADFMSGVKKIIAFSTDNESVIPLENTYLKKWGVPKDVLFAVADKNMGEILAQLNLYVSTIAGSIDVLEFPVENVKLRASLMLCSNFKKIVSQKLGGKFLVVAPSADSMLAIQDVTNNVIESFGPIVVDEFKKAADPISTEVLLFSPTGITVAGKFKVLKTPVEKIGEKAVTAAI
ncbi:MAG: hypothetical protein RR540_00305 [Oscillospiraceae bacterium]